MVSVIKQAKYSNSQTARSNKHALWNIYRVKMWVKFFLSISSEKNLCIEIYMHVKKINIVMISNN